MIMLTWFKILTAKIITWLILGYYAMFCVVLLSPSTVLMMDTARVSKTMAQKNQARKYLYSTFQNKIIVNKDVSIKNGEYGVRERLDMLDI